MEKVKIHMISDMLVMLQRSLKHIFRSLDTVITVTLTPIAMMLLFVYVFGGAMNGDMSRNEYLTYMLPGILVMSVASGIAYCAIRLFADIKSGIFDRFHCMPIAQSAPLWGHVLTSLVSNLLSIVVIIIVAFFLGLQSEATILGWLAIFGILTLLTLALTWIAIIAGLKANSVDGAGAFSYPLVFLPFLSSAFVPTDTMPYALKVFAENQPITSIVDTIRALLLNQNIGDEIYIALFWCLVILVFAYTIAMRIYNHRNQ